MRQETDMLSHNMEHGVIQGHDIDIDWIYSGIEYAYASDRVDNDEEEITIELVAQNLELLKRISLKPHGYMQCIPIIIQFANMIKVFMIEGVIFFRDVIRKPLQEWIQDFATRHDNSPIFEGIAINQRELMAGRFFSMFERFVEQYMAVSYHDRVFAQYLLVFFTRIDRWHSKYRMHILNEVAQQQIIKLFENNEWDTVGFEADEKIIRAYIDRYLSDQSLDTTTKFYQYASTQTASYLFSSRDVDFTTQMVWTDLFEKIQRLDVLADILSRSTAGNSSKQATWRSFLSYEIDNRKEIETKISLLCEKLSWL